MTYLQAYPSYLHGTEPQTTPDIIAGIITYAKRIITIPNVLGKTSQVVTVTPGIGTQEITNYALLEKTTGQTITFTSSATPTAAAVVTGLIAAWKANSILNGLATVSGTTTFIVTNRQSGLNSLQLQLYDGGSANNSQVTNNVLVASNSAPTNAGLIPWGVGLSVGATNKPGLPTAALSSSNLFTGVVGFQLSDLYSDPNYGQFPEQGWYPSSQAIGLLRDGQIAVKVLTAVDPTQPIYISYDTANATNGQFAASAVTGNYSQITSGINWASVTPANGIALLNVNLPA